MGSPVFAEVGATIKVLLRRKERVHVWVCVQRFDTVIVIVVLGKMAKVESESQEQCWLTCSRRN